jgi:hypothetical protein
MARSDASQRGMSCPFPHWGKVGMGASAAANVLPLPPLGEGWDGGQRFPPVLRLCSPFQHETY